MNNTSFLRDRQVYYVLFALRLKKRLWASEGSYWARGVYTFRWRKVQTLGLRLGVIEFLTAAHPVVITFMQCLHQMTNWSLCPPDSQTGSKRKRAEKGKPYFVMLELQQKKKRCTDHILEKLSSLNTQKQNTYFLQPRQTHRGLCLRWHQVCMSKLFHKYQFPQIVVYLWFHIVFTYISSLPQC